MRSGRYIDIGSMRLFCFCNIYSSLASTHSIAQAMGLGVIVDENYA
jgi:hypothetical protein